MDCAAVMSLMRHKFDRAKRGLCGKYFGCLIALPHVPYFALLFPHLSQGHVAHGINLLGRQTFLSAK